MPLTLNDGSPIDPAKHLQTRDEIAARFGGCSLFPGTVRGVWFHEGTRYEDESLRLTVDAEDTPDNLQFFVELKPVLRDRFQQIEIYIVSFPIEIV